MVKIGCFFHRCEKNFEKFFPSSLIVPDQRRDVKRAEKIFSKNFVEMKKRGKKHHLLSENILFSERSIPIC